MTVAVAVDFYSIGAVNPIRRARLIPDRCDGR